METPLRIWWKIWNLFLHTQKFAALIKRTSKSLEFVVAVTDYNAAFIPPSSSYSLPVLQPRKVKIQFSISLMKRDLNLIKVHHIGCICAEFGRQKCWGLYLVRSTVGHEGCLGVSSVQSLALSVSRGSRWGWLFCWCELYHVWRGPGGGCSRGKFLIVGVGVWFQNVRHLIWKEALCCMMSSSPGWLWELFLESHLEFVYSALPTRASTRQRGFWFL